MKKQSYYEVIVGNLGRVHTGCVGKVAHEEFKTYRKLSVGGSGRCGGESVVLMRDDEIIAEYDPTPMLPFRAMNRVQLIEGLYDYLMGVTESFEVDDVDADFAYLVGAVLKGGKCQWPESRPFVQLLRLMPISLISLRVKLLKHVEIMPEEVRDE